MKRYLGLKTTTSYLQSAQREYAEGAYAQAIEDFSRVITKRIEEINNVISVHPFITSYYSASRITGIQGTEKLRLLNQLKPLYRELAEAYYGRALTQNALGKKLLACKDYQSALMENSRLDQAYIQSLWGHANMRELAIVNYKCFLLLCSSSDTVSIEVVKNRRGPTTKADLIAEAEYQLSANNYQKAIEEYTKMLHLDPSDRQALFLRAAVSSQTNAIEDLTKIISLYPDDWQAYLKRAHIKINTKDPSGAIEDFDAVIRLNPHNTSIFNERAIIQAHLARVKAIDCAGKTTYSEAIKNFSLAINQCNKSIWSDKQMLTFALQDGEVFNQMCLAVGHGQALSFIKQDLGLEDQTTTYSDGRQLTRKGSYENVSRKDFLTIAQRQHRIAVSTEVVAYYFQALSMENVSLTNIENPFSPLDAISCRAFKELKAIHLSQGWLNSLVSKYLQSIKSKDNGRRKFLVMRALDIGKPNDVLEEMIDIHAVDLGSWAINLLKYPIAETTMKLLQRRESDSVKWSKRLKEGKGVDFHLEEHPIDCQIRAKIREIKACEESAEKKAAEEKKQREAVQKATHEKQQLAEMEAQKQRDAALKAAEEKKRDHELRTQARYLAEEQEKIRSQNEAAAKKSITKTENPAAKQSPSVTAVSRISTPRFFSEIPAAALIRTHEQLGSGGFGVVYKGKWQMIDVAVKELKVNRLSETNLANFRAEAELHGNLNHINIVRLLGICVEPSRYSMVMEFMPHGSLHTLLHSSQKISWPMRLSIARDIAVGLSYLHHHGILHRDLKSGNVLLDNHFQAKLSDFGLSKIKSESKSISVDTQQNPGTIQWMAPELFIRGSKCTEATDIYALAVTFYEIASGKVLFQDEEHADFSLMKEWIKDGERDAIPDHTPPSFAALITRGWQQRPEDRPRTAQIIAEQLSISASSGYERFSHG